MGQKTAVGINKNSDAGEINIFPNPSCGMFCITNSKASSLLISVYNVLGELVLKRECANTPIQMDLSSERKGIYFVEVEIEGKRINKKIVMN